ncbi:FAD-binding protein [Nocardia sp. NPDC047654]|uniref:FAD-binding protein n=1 Tax=Nocardia sp. NPDC047654 TaxID=3364314 RepID=UPI003715D06B
MTIAAPDSTWDLVVVGHGVAGLAAAKSFLDHSAQAGRTARVAVLERAPRSDRGGSSAWTTAFLRLTGEGELDPSWAENMRMNSGALIDEQYVSSFYANVPATLQWLQDLGVALDKVPTPFGTGWAWSVVGGGRAVVEKLLAKVTAQGADVFYETTAEHLVRDDEGQTTGVQVRLSDGTATVLGAAAVVLANGGFEGNHEMLSRYIADVYRLKTVSPGTMNNRGDGLRMALEVGAGTAGQFDAAHLEPCDARSASEEPLVAAWYWGILVNQAGERFMDEAERTYDIQFDSIANVTHRTQGGRSYAIIDQSVRRAVPFLDAMQSTALAPVTADTIEELAVKLGIDPQRLAATVAQYNAAAPGDIDPLTMDGRATTGITPRKSNYAQPLTDGPFEAWPIEPQICFTYGGVKVDAEAHVLDMDGRVISGLYAAGEVTGIFYKEYPAGTSVLRSMTFGREAGRVAAAEVFGAHASIGAAAG